MLVVAGTWELGWNAPIKEIDLWRFPLRDFGVDEFAMWPVSGIKSNKVKEFESLDAILKHYSGLNKVFLDESAATPLSEFKHPEEALYIFGKANTQGFDEHFNEGQAVKIETAINAGILWPHQAASIVLYDRFKKWH